MPIAINPNVHISGDLYVTLDNEEVLVKGTVASGQPVSDAPVLIGAETPANTVIEIQADASGNLFTDMIDRAGRLVGIVDTELPAAAALSDASANPTTPLIGACQMGWDAVGVHWERVLVVAGAMVVDTELTTEDFDTGAGTDDQAIIGLVYPGAGGHVTVTATVGLPVDVLDRAARDLGKVDIAVFDTAITAADATATPTTSPPVVGINMVYNGTNWDMMREGALPGSIIVDTELPAAAALADNMANPTTALIGACNMVWDGAQWDRVTMVAIADATANPATTGTAAYGMVWHPTGTDWDRAISAEEGDGVLTGLPAVGGFVWNGAAWDMIHEGAVAGSVLTDVADRAGRLVGIVDTELPAAALLSDAFANPTAPAVGAFLMGFDSVAGDWERVQVTPGTGHLDVAIQAVGVTVTVDTELPAAGALGDAMANPTTPLIGSVGMIWNGATYDRVTEGYPAGSVSVDPYYEPTRAVGTSAANTLQTVSTAVEPCKVLFVTVKWSAAVTQNVTVTLNAGAGAAYDTLLQTIAFVNETDGVWFPDSDVIIKNDDQLDVVAPAGGAGVTSAVQIYTQPVRA